MLISFSCKAKIFRNLTKLKAYKSLQVDYVHKCTSIYR